MAIGQLLTGQMPATQMQGVIGLVGTMSQTINLEKGYCFWWLLINFSLGIFNLLPIPVLDGGRLLTSAAVSLWGEKAEKPVKAVIYASLYLVLAFMIGLTIKDLAFLL